jgi:hypothetical protein
MTDDRQTDIITASVGFQTDGARLPAPRVLTALRLRPAVSIFRNTHSSDKLPTVTALYILC